MQNERIPARAYLVGVDGSEQSTDAVAWAAAQSSVSGRPLALVRALDWQWSTMTMLPFPPVAAPGTGDQQVREALRAELDRVVERTRAAYPGVEVVGAAHTGHPALVLGELADESEAEAVVIGASGSGALGHALLGSTASEVVRGTDRPVVVVRGRFAEQADKPVVVGVDGTDTSARAILFAFEHAAARNLPVTIVHAWSHTTLDPVVAPFLTPDDRSGRPVRDAVSATITAQVEQCQRLHPDVRVERLDPAEHPISALTDLSHEASLLVVGSHGRGRLGRALLGSVSQAMLNHAACPTAVLRELDDDPTEQADKGP